MNQLALTDEQHPVPNPAQIMMSHTHMTALVNFSELMANAFVMVPKHLHGKPADCLAIAMQAAQWGMNPFVVAQKTHVVNGTLGYEAQLVVAVLQNSGAVVGRPNYEYRGEGQSLECRVGFVPAGEQAIVWTEWLGITSIKVKNSPLWATNPKQQFGYLQARNWARLYAPGALLGVYTADEMEDTVLAANEPAPAPRGPKRKSEKPLEHVEEVPQDSTAPTPAPEPAPGPTEESEPTRAAPAATGTAMEASISTGQIAYLRNKLKAADVAESSICARFEVGGIEELSQDLFDLVKAELLSQI